MQRTKSVFRIFQRNSSDVLTGGAIVCKIRRFRPAAGFSAGVTVDVAQLVRALDCGSRGRGFESPHPPFLSPLYSSG